MDSGKYRNVSTELIARLEREHEAKLRDFGTVDSSTAPVSFQKTIRPALEERFRYTNQTYAMIACKGENAKTLVDSSMQKQFTQFGNPELTAVTLNCTVRCECIDKWVGTESTSLSIALSALCANCLSNWLHDPMYTVPLNVREIGSNLVQACQRV